MKKLKLFTMAMIAMFAMVVTVNAATITDLKEDPYKDSVEVTEDDEVTTIKLLKTAEFNLEVKDGEKVVLDLNGHTLNNTIEEGKLQVDCPTIKVEKNGTLTIKDSGTSGSITRTKAYPESQLQQAIIDNYGELNLEGGFISPQIASVYGIRNLAGATINVSGGRVSTLYEKNYGLWNAGTANISGGQFDQSYQADMPAVVNSQNAKMNITGGIFRDMTGKKIQTVAPVTGSETIITGGQFDRQDPETFVSEPQDMSAFIPDGYIVDSYGKVMVKPVEITPEIPGADDVVTTDSETSDVLKESLLNTTDEELKELIENNDVTVVLEAKETTVDDDKKKEFADALPDATISKYLDISVLVKAGTTIRNLHELDEEITLTVKVPEDLPEVKEGYTRVYYILREHDGKVEVLKTVLSEDGTELSFATDKFSTYALAYEDQANAGTTSNPDTVDSIGSYLILSAIACTGLVALGYSIKKKFEN